MNVKAVCAILLSCYVLSDALPTPVKYDGVVHPTNGKGLSGLRRTLAWIEQKLGSVGREVSCSLCKTVAGFLRYYLELGKTEDEIVKEFTKVCIDFKIEDERVCYGVVREFKDEVLTVFDMAVVTPDDICGTILGPTCANAGTAYGPWNVTFPNSTRTRRMTTGKSVPNLRVCFSECPKHLHALLYKDTNVSICN